MIWDSNKVIVIINIIIIITIIIIIINNKVIIILATRASYIARSGLPAVSRKNNLLKNHCDDR